MSVAFLASVFGAGLATAQLDYSNPYSFTTLAGVGSPGSADGTGSAARFLEPEDVAVDTAGNVYVADPYNSTIRKITPAGIVTTLAGRVGTGGSADGAGANARFAFSQGVATDPAGNVYVADTANSTIRKITPAGDVSTLAGQAGSSGSQDGTGGAATFSFPTGVAVDSGGNVLAKDRERIRKITPAGVVSTLATIGTQSFEIATDRNGNVYVANSATRTLSRLDAAGQSTFLAGSTQGNADGTGSGAQFQDFRAITVDAGGNVFAMDFDRLRKVTPAGVVTTLAPVTTSTELKLYSARGLAIDASGNLYVADTSNNAIRKITPGLALSTLAGSLQMASWSDANATGSAARIGDIQAMAFGPNGDIYLATANHTIRKVTRSGVVTTIAGISGVAGNADGPATTATFDTPSGIAADSSGNLYVATALGRTVRKISGGVVSTFAGSAGLAGTTDGTGSAARFSRPAGLVADASGNLYVADSESMIRKITPAGVVTTLAGSTTAGNADGTGAAAQFNGATQLAIDASGNLYVSGAALRKVTPAGVVTTLAGIPNPVNTGDTSVNDGPAASARFGMFKGVAIDAAGNVYVSDGRLVRKVSASGIVSTLGGLKNLIGSEDGIGAEARFANATSLLVDSTGVLYVGSSSTVRRGTAPGAPTITSQPKNLAVTVGDSVQFSVTATGSPAPTYQWYFNGGAFSGGTGATLSFTNARATDAGDYSVTVTNTLGSDTSTKATLTVNAATPPPATGGSGGNTGGSSSGGGGGGGGAPSLWFVLVLSALGWHRVRAKSRGAR